MWACGRACDASTECYVTPLDLHTNTYILCTCKYGNFAYSDAPRMWLVGTSVAVMGVAIGAVTEACGGLWSRARALRWRSLPAGGVSTSDSSKVTAEFER